MADNAITLLRAGLLENTRLATDAQAEAEREPFVKGSMGQLKPHPRFEVAARCDAIAVKIAHQLGIVPEEGEEPIAFDELDLRRKSRP